MNLEVAQLIIPLMDFIVRWEMFSDRDKELTREYLTTVGFDDKKYFIVKSFLDALDLTMED